MHWQAWIHVQHWQADSQHYVGCASVFVDVQPVADKLVPPPALPGYCAKTNCGWYQMLAFQHNSSSLASQSTLMCHKCHDEAARLIQCVPA